MDIEGILCDFGHLAGATEKQGPPFHASRDRQFFQPIDASVRAEFVIAAAIGTARG
jgi:hypothetical protein